MISAKLARFGLLALGTALLAGCTATGPSNLRVHEATLYGAGAQRIAWVYGDLGSSASSSLKLGNDTVTLRPQANGDLALPGTLSVNGKAAYTAPLGSVTPRLSLNRDGDGSFTVTPTPSSAVKAIYYTDGRQWQQLEAVSGHTMGRSSSGLRGAGQLTDAEADALTRALSNQGVLAVAVLDESAVPDTALKVEPKPTEQRRTALYVLSAAQITTVTSKTTTTTTKVVTTPSPAPTTPGGQNMSGTVASQVASGSNAATESADVIVARSSSEVRALYNVAYGRQTGAPALPTLRPGEALVGIFIGRRSTGGYSVRLSNANVEGSTLNLRVELTAPKADSITTQALTSPWVIVKIGSAFSNLNVTDQSGRTFPY